MENGDGRAKIIQVIAGSLTLFPIFVVATQHSSYIMKEDQILIEQLNASSIEAFSELYNKYAGMVFNFTHAILKDTYLSEDITQSCFAQMWTRRTSISPDGNMPAWLYVVARNAVFKELRRQVAASKYIDYVANSGEIQLGGVILKLGIRRSYWRKLKLQSPPCLNPDE